jgi:hypothetical protein
MLSAPFAQALAVHRTAFNSRVAQARARDRAFDADTFGAFLVRHVDGLVAAVAAVAPQAVPGVVDAAFDLAMVSAGRGEGQAHALWQVVAPRYAALLAQDPHAVLAMLGNALVHLHGLDGARPGQWAAEMAAIAPDVETVGALRVVGQVLAWRAGAAHFRHGAIVAADALPGALACAAFGVRDASSWPALRAQLLDEPWWRAPADLLGNPHARIDREVGAFTGLGGAFPAPPQVRPCAGGFLVQAGDHDFFLVADAYGAVLHALPDMTPGVFPQRFTLTGSNLATGLRVVALDLPAEGLAACCNDASIAVTSPWTHAIRVLALA